MEYLKFKYLWKTFPRKDKKNINNVKNEKNIIIDVLVFRLKISLINKISSLVEIKLESVKTATKGAADKILTTSTKPITMFKIINK